MARYPAIAPHVETLAGSVYSKLGSRLAQADRRLYPLHVGDTWMEPAIGCRMQDLTVEDHPGMHRYTSVHGLPALLDAIIARTEATQGLGAEREQVLVTAGGTGGLFALLAALLDPGDEVLITAPFWPLIGTATHAVRGKPVPVPFFDVAHDAASAVAALQAACTDRTVAVYWNTPHNPTGRIIPGDWLEAMAAWARKRDLWILADEVYGHFAWGGEHVYTRPMAPERTFSVQSFSKAYGLTGLRTGYLVGPAHAINATRRVATNSVYCAPHPGQLAGLAAMAGPGEVWAAEAAKAYREIGEWTADRLGVARPQGSTFLFIDVAHRLDDRGLEGALYDLADDGVFVAPGTSFGPYPTHLRLCYTAAPPAVTREGVEIFARWLGR
ncbi:MAG: pyridoxal phosphate-dependent aminotransferase [Myxococcales bacterium]|nr:pyridoxal phosphate-dependent aminotransferase [Myxococcales bacterium]